LLKKNYFLNAILIFILIPLLSCSGCWERHELNSMAIVTGVAFDAPDSQETVSMTVQVVVPGAMGTSNRSRETSPFWNITTGGKTVFDAVRNCTQQSPRKLFFGHNQVIIFDKELAKSGIEQYIDFFLRNPEPRDTTWVLVAEEKASDILEVKTKLEAIPALNLCQLIKARSATSSTTGVDLHEFTERLLSKTTAPVASYVKAIGDSERSLFLSGTAVFNNDLKMVGILNKWETRGMLWILGDAKSGIIVVKSPHCNVAPVSLEIIESSSKIEPVFIGDTLQIIIKVREQGNLGEFACYGDVLSPDMWHSLENRQAAAIQNEIMMALNKARELNADIFGFGEAVHKKYPEKWKELEPRWEEIFPALEVQVFVDSKLVQSGLTLQGIK